MFIDVIWPNKEESRYECSRRRIVPLTDSRILFILDGHLELEIDKYSGTEVYEVNNEGRTIEAHRWASKPEVNGQSESGSLVAAAQSAAANS